MMLLHICCGPCAVYPAELLKSKGIVFDAYFYNPNIQPLLELEKRKEFASLWAEMNDIDIYVSSEHEKELWERSFTSKKERCDMCYNLRISNICEYAKINGYSSVTSSLLVSPYQDHERIKDLFEMYSKKAGIDFYYVDFRTGYRQGQVKAKEIGLYRQKYCGCLQSINESAYMQKHKQNS